MSADSKLDFQKINANKSIAARNYWRNRLSGFEFKSFFNPVHTAMAPCRLEDYPVHVSHAQATIYENLMKIAGSDKAKQIILLATLGVFTQKYSFATDVVILTAALPGTTDNAVIPFRIDDLPGTNFPGFVMVVKEKLLQDSRFSNYPVEKILDTSDGLPLIAMQVKGQEEETHPAFSLLQPDLLFSFSIRGSLALQISYNPAKFNPEYIGQIARHYFNLLSNLIRDRETDCSLIGYLDKREENKLLNEFNDTDAYYPKEETIVSLFEKQVARTPGNLAIRYGAITLSYAELKQKADRIASYLQANGVATGDLVGIMLEREEYLLPCIFGILKAGAAYVPIDPAYPAERTNSILEGSQLKTLITRKGYINEAVKVPPFLIDLDKDIEEILTGSPKLLNEQLHSGNLAYVIYTSGSTGKPKGVMIEHHAVINRLLWMQKKYPLTEQDVLLLKTPVTFDVSVWELFWWSFTGASLYLLKPGGEKDPAAIIAAVKTSNVTTIHFVPSMLQVFLSTLKDDLIFNQLLTLRQVFASGEALKPDHVRLFGNTLYKHCGTRLINLYGPTEATVDVSFYECNFSKEYSSVPIGKAIDNIRLYILDKNNLPAPVGVPGELCIAGVGLARGYLNNTKLTEEKFIHHPFIAGERLYRTGDLVKWQADGNILYIGRLDHQVKIRGFRIELGDIESQLMTYGSIKEAVVVVREKENDKYLVAYYVSDGAVDAADLKKHLSSRLPAYMFPASYVHLYNMPVTANGKLNRNELPDPPAEAGEEYIAPSNSTEERLVEIWAEVLEIDKDKISVSRSFFELGGNSLKIIRVNAVVNELFRRDISIPDMFRYATISALTDFINGKDDDKEAPEMNEADELFGMHNVINTLSE